MQFFSADIHVVGIILVVAHTRKR